MHREDDAELETLLGLVQAHDDLLTHDLLAHDDLLANDALSPVTAAGFDPVREAVAPAGRVTGPRSRFRRPWTLVVAVTVVVVLLLAGGGAYLRGRLARTAGSGTAGVSAPCRVATVSDADATITVAHGGLTAVANYGVNGPLGGHAIAFDGSTAWLGTGDPPVKAPQIFTELAWFTTYSSGIQPILGSANTMRPAGATAADRAVWLDGGHVVAGVYRESDDTTAVLTSPASYNDGTWHLAAVTLSSGGFFLYVDGKPVAARRSVVSAQDYPGWWTIGAANLGGWPHGLPSHGVGYWKGSLAGVAVLPVALTADQIHRLSRVAKISEYEAGVTAKNPIHYWNLQDTTPSVVTTPRSGPAATCP